MKMKSGKEMTIIPIPSRYDFKHHLLRLAKGVYILKSAGLTHRVSTNITNLIFKFPNAYEYKFVDPSGGPMIEVGTRLPINHNAITVKYILSVPFTTSKYATIILSKSVSISNVLNVYSNILKLLQENEGDIQQFYSDNRF